MVLALKTYGIYSSITKRAHLKAKGIPQWMIVITNPDEEQQEIQASNLDRCLFNGNERQFTF